MGLMGLMGVMGGGVGHFFGYVREKLYFCKIKWSKNRTVPK